MAEEVEWGPFDEDYETAGGVVEGGGRRGGGLGEGVGKMGEVVMDVCIRVRQR